MLLQKIGAFRFIIFGFFFNIASYFIGYGNQSFLGFLPFFILFRYRLEFSFCGRYLLADKNLSKRRKIQGASLQRFLCVWHSSISIFIVWSIVILFLLGIFKSDGFLYPYCDSHCFSILPKIYQDSLRFKDWCLDVSLALQRSFTIKDASLNKDIKIVEGLTKPLNLSTNFLSAKKCLPQRRLIPEIMPKQLKQSKRVENFDSRYPIK